LIFFAYQIQRPELLETKNLLPEEIDKGFSMFLRSSHTSKQSLLIQEIGMMV
jgi:hypothetical protein